jgi:hypothetical protein
MLIFGIERRYSKGTAQKEVRPRTFWDALPQKYEIFLPAA